MKEKNEQRKSFTVDRPLTNPLSNEEIEKYKKEGFEVSYSETRTNLTPRDSVAVTVPTARYIFRPIKN